MIINTSLFYDGAYDREKRQVAATLSRLNVAFICGEGIVD
ncbi:hypothetical protein VCHE16_3287 [Vibrio paracholerae HE-16]|nr:hypothetical protein VCHE09_2930 [Vibrio paracholerae HE-09]EKG84863.1 hypothetical protein VCHE16_3287 [Vibrio paracholerae HE-16]EMP90933.1 hypothetical protein VC87395_003085 [Vibrio paracholerae 87395]